jgi:hypothetical protein
MADLQKSFDEMAVRIKAQDAICSDLDEAGRRYEDVRKVRKAAVRKYQVFPPK